MSRAQPRERCGRCRHFVDDPVAFERMLPGILALSSGQGDSRGDQGVCRIHRQLLTPGMTCRQFAARQPTG